MAAATKPQQQISAFLSERISAGDFPSAVYLISQKGREIFSDALGRSVVQPYQIESSLDTIYDLASLTKPLVTTMFFAKRFESGELRLEDRVSQYLRESDTADKASITLRHLLTHTSGLPAWKPLYILADDERARVLEVIAATPLDFEPGTRVIYSDLGFIVLGILLVRITGKTLDVLAQEEIFSPLNLQRTFFNPKRALQTGIAACETGNAYERTTSLESGSKDYGNWRTSLIWGEVHDGNAYFLGGFAGHAGLFSTANETTRLASQFIAEESELLNAETYRMFRTNMTEGLNEARSVGWQLAATSDSTAGSALPLDSFGHNGFTGTSCWIDPHAERVFVLLTNRTHSRPLPFQNINSVRRQFHSLATAALDITITR
jgi:serine-type D-Ala-D-Ala carboxypeptidase